MFKNMRGSALFLGLLLMSGGGWMCAEETAVDETAVLTNGRLRLEVIVRDGRLAGERLTLEPAWMAGFGGDAPVVESDGDFGLDLMWTGWRAPGFANNAENPLGLSRTDFRVTDILRRERAGGNQEIVLEMSSEATKLAVRVIYQLPPDAFYCRRQVSVRQTGGQAGHFLRRIWPVRARLAGDGTILKAGGFGQPVAIRHNDGGAFWGVEYPAAENRLAPAPDGAGWRLECGHEVGLRLSEQWWTGEPVVMGLTPQPTVRRWFGRYLDDIRVAPLRPYLLYNTWYDLRAPEMVDDPAQVLNEQNLLRIIDLFRSHMTEKYGLTLDAFVLDDGWDVYRSDWVLRPDQFPNGLRPVADALAATDTDLGIWFGPIGGYSHRGWRLEWMTAHGYEAVGDQLCLAGTNYHQLFRQRVTDMVANDGVAYFKWDGIQFSCSEPDHGHPVGLYSRRAVMEAVADLCAAVREKNPDTYLNITSGTWLSPWWLKYADQIWMQGHDYGWADVPSVSRRDAAITYRDVVLYEDFGQYDFWFPMANLMTHGIIKGHLQKLGGEAEPLDKFTDNALLYFARGVSMWELYVSPDLLSDGEWAAIARSAAWARDRFDILRHTVMIGGDPGAGEAYGYAHFEGRRGIVVLRNPVMKPQSLEVALSPALGLDAAASDLVMEQVYPVRRISPRLVAAGDRPALRLEGFETAVFEFYPLADCERPLLADAWFSQSVQGGRRVLTGVYGVGPDVKVLNPEKIARLEFAGRPVAAADLPLVPEVIPPPVTQSTIQPVPGRDHQRLAAILKVDPSVYEAELSLLLEADEEFVNQPDPVVEIIVDGETRTAGGERQTGRWGWYTLPLDSGERAVQYFIRPGEKADAWRGTAELWLTYRQRSTVRPLFMEMKQDVILPPMPPAPYSAGGPRRTLHLHSFEVEVTAPVHREQTTTEVAPVTRPRIAQAAVASDRPALMPAPQSLQWEAGQFQITPDTVIMAEAGSAELWRTARYLAEKLGTASGYTLAVEERTQSTPPPGSILLTTVAGDASLGEEGYELEVRLAGIVVRAPRPCGVFRGVQTLRQLLPPAIESAAPVAEPPDWVVPAVTIRDQAAFPWRGMLLDCCRHFMSVDFIKRYIDLLAYHKMNRFHWHLTEDQGWRIEIDKYPRLTEIGAWRNEGGVPYGGYYTKAEIRDVVAYAAERYITVVPEIEMPGHSQAALAAYPEYSCTGGPFDVGTRWGVYEDVYCAGNDGTFAFLQDILDEVVELFPGPYIHLGADECPKSRWQECPRCQARIEQEGLADEHELQSYFIRRMAEYLRGKGKQVIGWDEIMEGGLTEGVIVQYWRTRTGDSTVVEAARAGHQVIVSPTSHCYFDYPYSAIDLATVYTLQPVPDGLSAAEQARIMGGEGNMWTERAPQEVVDQRLFPRILALAEVLWRSPERRDLPEFLRRVGAHYPRLIHLGVRGQVPTPLILPAEAVVPDRAAVEVRLDCGLDDAEIRYSLDGSPLGDTAVVYTGPFRLDRNAVVRAVAFHPDLAPSLVAEQRFQVGYLAPATPAALLTPGLIARYYEGSWPILPDFTKLESVNTVRVTTVDLSPRQREDEYGLEFSGYFRVEQKGIYTFSLRSDDGSTLEVGGLTVVDNDGRHGTRERAGQVALAAGDHPFRLCYFEADGEQGLEVLVEGPGLARQPLPAGMLWSPPLDR